MNNSNLLTEQTLLSLASSKEEYNFYGLHNVLDSNIQLSTSDLDSKAVIPKKSIKKKKKFGFEHNPSIRRRQHTRLIRKLCMQIEEYNVRIGQQAVIATCSNDHTNFFKSFRVFGSQPLENIVKSRRPQICKRLYEISMSESLLNKQDETLIFNLPSILLNGEPCPLNSMTQTHLRCFIPEMLKAATGRCKPGWGKEECRPLWWPLEVPWENVRTDARDENQKKLLPWTQCLKKIVRSCYTYHNRVDLLLDNDPDPNFNISLNLIDEKELLNITSTLNTDGKRIIQIMMGTDNKLALESGQSDTPEVDEVIMCVQSNEELHQLFKDGYLKVNSVDFEKIMNQLT